MCASESRDWIVSRQGLRDRTPRACTTNLVTLMSLAFSSKRCFVVDLNTIENKFDRERIRTDARGTRAQDARVSIPRTPLNRRALLGASCLVTVAALGVSRPAFGAPLKPEDLVGPEIPDSLAGYFRQYVSAAQQAIGESFNARLVVYGVTQRLPFGTPGDPSKEYGKIKRLCGDFHPPGKFGEQPYDCCSSPDADSNPTSRECCRHYAYCVPYDRFPASPSDSVSSIVVSSRVMNLPDDTIKGILAHEIGHAIDFHIYGKRYRLQNRACTFENKQVESEILEIDATASDPEYRADMFANALVLRDRTLCYQPDILLQTLTPLETDCISDGLLQHFSHQPIQGRRAVI